MNVEAEKNTSITPKKTEILIESNRKKELLTGRYERFVMQNVASKVQNYCQQSAELLKEP